MRRRAKVKRSSPSLRAKKASSSSLLSSQPNMASNKTITLPNTASKSQFLEKSLPRRAFVTLLAGNGDDYMGVQGLAMGLKKVRSRYPLVVAILPDVPVQYRRILQDLGCILKEIQPVYQLKKYAQLALEFPYVTKYSKLFIWKIVEYSKMIYLEGDTQVFANIDFLFDFPDGYIHAPLGCFCPEAWSHPLYEQCPESSKWPTELGPKPSSYYSVSMFVFEPSTSILNDLLNTLKSIIRFQPIPFAEQHVLNMFFRKRLSAFPGYVYGALTMVDEKNIDHLEKVMVIRYGSPELKPWRHPTKMGKVYFVNKLKRKWKDICPGRSLDSEELKSVKRKNLLNFPSASGTK